MAALARLFLLLVAAAFAWNLARGTERTWLRAKFLGKPGGALGPTAPSGNGPYAVPDQGIPGVQGPQTSTSKTNVEVTI